MAQLDIMERINELEREIALLPPLQSVLMCNRGLQFPDSCWSMASCSLTN